MFTLFALLVLFVATPTLAFAVADPAADPSGWFSELYSAITNTEWKHVAAVALIGVVYAIRTWGPKKVSWFKDSARGGAVLVLLLAIGTGCANALLAGEGVTLKTFATSLQVAIEAAIGWAALFKALVENKK